MLKACTVFRKRADLTDQAFQEYWRTKHCDAIRNLPNVRRYVQSHPIIGVNKPFGYDGLTQIWVDDIEVFKEFASSGRFDAVIEDEKQFADRSSIELHLCDEHVVLAGDELNPPGVKQVFLVKRKAGISPAEFQQYWAEQHSALVGTPPGLLRYVQNHPRLGGYKGDREPIWDGFGEMWYSSIEAMKQASRAPGQDKVAADAATFIDVEKMRHFVVQEHVVIG